MVARPTTGPTDPNHTSMICRFEVEAVLNPPETTHHFLFGLLGQPSCPRKHELAIVKICGSAISTYVTSSQNVSSTFQNVLIPSSTTNSDARLHTVVRLKLRSACDPPLLHKKLQSTLYRAMIQTIEMFFWHLASIQLRWQGVQILETFSIPTKLQASVL